MDKWGCLSKSKLMVKGMCGENLWKCLQTLLGYDIGQLLLTCWWPHWTLVLVLFSQFSFFETHQSKSSKQISAPTVTIISRQTELNHVKESERERFWYMKNNHKVYRFNENRILGSSAYCVLLFRRRMNNQSSQLFIKNHFISADAWTSDMMFIFFEQHLRFVFLSCLAGLLFTNTDSHIAWKQRI